MSIAKRPGLVTRGKAKAIEEFERYASEDAAEDVFEKDPKSEDDAVSEHVDEYQTMEEMINNAEGNDDEISSEQ